MNADQEHAAEIAKLDEDIDRWMIAAAETAAGMIEGWKREKALIDKVAYLRSLLQRCLDDPGIAFTLEEHVSQVQLWGDVERALADIEPGPHNVLVPRETVEALKLFHEQVDRLGEPKA